jgi:hypothetical protein
MSSPNYKANQAAREAARCDERVTRGTGEAFCDRPLDERGQCDRAGDHL